MQDACVSQWPGTWPTQPDRDHLLSVGPGAGVSHVELVQLDNEPVQEPLPPSSGGKTYHGRIVKQGNKWLRWAFVEAVAPAIATDPQLRDQYERLKPHGTNKARVAVARKLLTIAFQLLRDRRPYVRRGASRQECASPISRLS